MSAPLPIFVLAGGTGGHVYPALAVALALRERGYGPRWIGTSRGLEARVVPAANIPLHTLPMRGVRGKNPLRQLQALFLLGASLLWSVLLVLRHRPRLVIGMGGYASVPAALAAWCCRRPLLLQEQNAVAGSANRLLARFARCVTTGFPGVLAGRGDVRYLGNPVREDLLGVATAHPWQWAGERPLQVLVLGGSLGAQAINEAVPTVAGRLGDRCHWRHQCGTAHEVAVREAWQAVGAVEHRVEPFIENMADAFAWADLVICRAGALTVAELAVTGRPAILVPLPGAIDDHQTANARFLTDDGAARLLIQKELVARLEPVLRELLDDPATLAQMARVALARARPTATRDIADCAEELLR
jgi:UDP-N-acetylglucosamine--N-acetylmuramyl-(pentapeptide) pyrophosphoryl-undecaprenol N-acetylglucosamine transferase